MNEFRLHHLVSELLSTFQLEGGDSADSYVELLSKNMSPYVTTQVSLCEGIYARDVRLFVHACPDVACVDVALARYQVRSPV